MTPPTPPKIPSTTSERSISLPIKEPTQSPETLTAASTASINGVAQEKIAWKTATTTIAKMMGPAIGWRKTPSRRRVQMGGAGAR